MQLSSNLESKIVRERGRRGRPTSLRVGLASGTSEQKTGAMSSFSWQKQRSAAASLGVVAALASAAAFTPPLALRHRNAVRGGMQCPVLATIPAAAVPVATPVLRAKKCAIAHARARTLTSSSRARKRPVRATVSRCFVWRVLGVCAYVFERVFACVCVYVCVCVCMGVRVRARACGLCISTTFTRVRPVVMPCDVVTTPTCSICRMCPLYVEYFLYKKYFGRRHRTADIGFAYGCNVLRCRHQNVFNVCRTCSVYLYVHM